MMRLPATGCQMPSVGFSSAGCHLSAVVYRLSAVGCVCLGAAMRFCPGSCINLPILFVGVCGLWGLACPSSRKWPEIAYRDNDFCPGRNVNRLTLSPGQFVPRGGEGFRNGAGHHCGWRQIRVREQWDEDLVAGVGRDVVVIAPGSPTRKAGRTHAVWLGTAHRPHTRVQWRVVAVHEGHMKEHRTS